MMSLKTKKIGIFSLILTTLSVGALVWVISVISQMGEDLVIAKQILAEAKAETVERKYVKELIVATEEERLELDSLILKDVDDVDIVGLVGLLENIALEQGLNFETTKLGIGPHSNNQFEILSIHVSATGNFEALVHLIKLYEQLPYQVVIKNISFNESPDPSVWESVLKLEVTKYKIL